MLVYRFGAVALPAGRQRRQHRQGLRLDREQRRRRRATSRIVNSSDRYALIAVQGPKRAGDPADADRRRSRRRSSTTGSRTARSPASAARSRAPATPAKTASKIFVPPHMADRCGTRCSRPGSPHGLIPRGPRRARHAAPRSRDAPLRQRHRRDDHGARSRPRLDRRLEQGRRSSAATCCARRRRAASTASIVGFEMIERAIARHGHRGVPRRRSRSASSPAARRRRS